MLAKHLSRHPVLAFVTVAIAGGTVATIAAREVVEQIYVGRIFPDLFEGRTSRPLDYYLSRANRLVIGTYAVAAVAAAACLVARRQNPRMLLAVLLGGDLLCAVLSQAYGGVFDVRLDRGVPEFFQYLKEGGAAVVLLLLFKATARRVFLPMGLLFAFFLLDDALRYHETAGQFAAALPGAEALGKAMEVRASDVGEVISVAPVLLILVGSLAVVYRGGNAEDRHILHRFGALLLVLLAFGGVLDILDQVLVSRQSRFARPLMFIEDAGEMVTMSAMVTQAFWLRWTRRPRINQ